ncbi:SusC/RagA family TonB-linked outer membrane protein [Flavobacterium restrictum]|uniref:Uncharacterized protein n=1 Tax=Flavobacterium restrictum TaxID=2594428 RepID=A0A553E8K4_9FLAO|nr:hypothetical protein [Flavobacterium restrictum]TRX41356.1 hypothetical protein FNW21_04465 [Flavobacterium restrictum]
MKNAYLALLFFCIQYSYSQGKQNPLIVLDAKKIGFMQDLSKEMEALNPNDISTVTVYKDSIVCQKYGSNSGVIVITTKKFILDTFYKNYIENSGLKNDIHVPDDLLKIGIVSHKPDSKNQPYDEFYNYIDTYTLSEKIKKIAAITFLKPEDALKINPEWKLGALEIKGEEEY